ncbi:MAG TPA: selenium cofactor biosynthesis protein YqeC [Anaerolineales bacterium]|nr:selenium cofactor biosynthesis protein YqeC [Anaerolineales bacterium]
MNVSLAQALRAQPSQTVAFVGAGGKTTAMFQLARGWPPPVIITATSHLGAWQTRLADQHLIMHTHDPLETIEAGLKGTILITGELDGDRTRPIDDSLLKRLHKLCGHHSIPLLIEADGSRGKPLKAWADHEPPIPPFVDLVVQVAGLAGLGQPLNGEHVHRAERFSKLSGLMLNEPVTPDSIVRLLMHPDGGLKNIPLSARRVVLLNQADTDGIQSAARGIAQALLPAYHAAIISSLSQERIFAVYERIAGIILAAGGSTRFGQPKQLLDWRGQSFVRVVAKTALEAGLDPVVVVTGAHAEQVGASVADLRVRLIQNQDWASGQGSSIRVGVASLISTSQSPTESQVPPGGVVFLLTDQPQVTPSILRALVDKHAEGLCPIVAPMVMDQRANPVLFDRVTFNDLLQISGDVGGRAVFHKHRVEYLPWHDDRLLLDVDTPEMYQRLISDNSL